MRTNNRIIIGTRGSKLALIQAQTVKKQVAKIYPALKIEIRKIITEGDRNQVINIEDTGEVGIFVKALEEALVKCEIDMAVHSLKDLPVVLPDKLSLLAVIEREDQRDAIVAAKPFNELKPGSKIGTSSVRRSAQLRKMRPDIQVTGIRGNVDTRLRKVATGEIDGLIVAAAAMLRLGRKDEITEYLPVESFVPAAGQGAIGIEARTDDEFAASLGLAINHVPTWLAVKAERAFLAYLGGGCSAPISCTAVFKRGSLIITGMVSDRDGDNMVIQTMEGQAENPEEAGEQLAKEMLKSGAKEIMDKIRCRQK